MLLDELPDTEDEADRLPDKDALNVRDAEWDAEPEAEVD